MVIEVIFLLVGLAAVTVGALCARRVLIVIGLLRHGQRAEGTCVGRRLNTISGAGDGSSRSYPEYVFAFRTADGTSVEFKDRPGMFGQDVGAEVRVSYDPKRPRERATIAGPDHWGPVYVPALFCLGAVLLGTVPMLALAASGGLL